MKYRILEERMPGLLETRVNRYLEKGWEPIGGLVVMDEAYYQTIIKKENDDI